MLRAVAGGWLRNGRGSWGGFTPFQTFSTTGANGAWLDESDFSTLFQDSAGTTQVTAVELPIGLIKDKSGRTNNVLQATAVSRPVVSSRVNQLSAASEDVSNAVYTKSAVTIGGTTKIQEDNTNTLHYLFQVSSLVAGVVTYRARLQQAERTVAWMFLNTAGTALAYFDLAAGTVGAMSGTGSPSATISTRNADGSYDCTLTVTVAASANFGVGAASSNGVNSYTGVTGNGIFALRQQVEQGSVASRYQFVSPAGVYDDSGFNRYAACNGTNSTMASTTGGGGTLGFFFCQAISPKNRAACTLWSDAGTNTGFKVGLNASGNPTLSAGNGTAYTTVTSTDVLPLGTPSVICLWDDGVNLNAQVGTTGTVFSVARPVVVAGTAAFTLWSDNGAATGFFNGNSYPEVYFKDTALTSAQRLQEQNYCKTKAGL